MRTLSVILALVACLAGPGLWAQAADAGSASGTGPASGTGSTTTDSGSGANGAGSTTGAASGSDSSSESDFFGTAPVEAPKGTAEKQDVAASVEQEHVGLSGQLQAMSTYSVARSYLEGSGNLADNTFSNVVGGDFLVDMRLTKGFKAFLDLNIGYVPGGTPTTTDFTVLSGPAVVPPGTALVLSQNEATALLIKEVFIDFNVANTVYFRAGKQVLKWGTGYFWNPSDLINIEHRSFTNLNALLEGTFGLRSDVVFSPAWHLYTFLNLNTVTNNVWDAAFAARSEFLVGSTEFAVSSWLKSGKIPVFGGDLSTPLPLDWWAKDGQSLNLTAEGTVSYGDNQDKFDPTTLTAYSVSSQLVPKIDVGLSRNFNVFDVQDRVTVALEFFYNGDGYDQNMFQLLSALPYPQNTAALGAFVGNGYFQSGYYGKYYTAAFITINDFGTTNMTLTLSGLANLSDGSGTALAGFSWSPVNNFTLGLQLGSDLGPNYREYTIAYNPTTFAPSNNGLFAILTATVNF